MSVASRSERGGFSFLLPTYYRHTMQKRLIYQQKRLNGVQEVESSNLSTQTNKDA